MYIVITVIIILIKLNKYYNIQKKKKNYTIFKMYIFKYNMLIIMNININPRNITYNIVNYNITRKKHS